MRFTHGNHGRLSAPSSWTLSAALTFLLVAAAGCGSHKAEQASVTPSSDGGSTVSATVAANTPDAPAQSLTTTQRRGRAGTIHRITLTDKRCIRFDPQWTDVRLGQSVTWHSELKAPLTIYVSPGVFSRDHFLVRPGATVTTGPALASGRYSFWTEPSACRVAPRGVLMAGPGVRVQETFYASTGPR
jgi:hypothetical protein